VTTSAKLATDGNDKLLFAIHSLRLLMKQSY
jgi:hypothetical protein